MLRIYYAHPMSWYGTDRERADVKALAEHGEVINPNSERFEQLVNKAKRNSFPVMQIFADFIRQEADVVAFRRFSGDHKIGAGVAREVLEARIWNKQIWEVIGGRGVFNSKPVVNKFTMDAGQFDVATSFDLHDVLTVDETRDRIARRQL